MKISYCEKYSCFQSAGGFGCKLLTEPITDHPCPFYKTEAEADAGRMEAHKKLIDKGLKCLIDRYEYNPQRKGSW